MHTLDIEKDFNEKECWGLSCSIDIKKCNPKLIRSKEAIQTYVIDLCLLINMKRYGDSTIVHFGEDEKVSGYSMAQFIETSLISGHFANHTNAVYIDIFSCKIFSPYKAMEFTCEFFEAKNWELQIAYRK